MPKTEKRPDDTYSIETPQYPLFSLTSLEWCAGTPTNPGLARVIRIPSNPHGGVGAWSIVAKGSHRADGTATGRNGDTIGGIDFRIGVRIARPGPGPNR